MSKAPVIQHFAETISGSTTIRSFDQERRFQETSMKLIDGNSRPKFHSAGVMEWLCFRLDMLSNLTFAFTLVFLITVPVGTIDPSEWIYVCLLSYIKLGQIEKINHACSSTSHISTFLMHIYNTILVCRHSRVNSYIWTWSKYVTISGNMEPLQFGQ